MNTVSNTLNHVVTGEMVRVAAKNFGEALTRTPEYQSFLVASKDINADAAAMSALRAFREKQRELQTELQMNILTDEQREVLEQLRLAFVNEPATQAYYASQGQFTALCQSLGDRLTEATGLPISSACGGGCCG